MIPDPPTLMPQGARREGASQRMTIQTGSTEPSVTLVVPVFNEQDAIAPFLSEVRAIMPDCGARLDVVFVDDGSTDLTVACIERQAHQLPITLVKLTKHFGKEAALTAGLAHAQGDAVVPIDVDLQDPPVVVAQFIAHWRDGYDVVYGVRASRASDTALKRHTAALFYRVFNKLSRDRIPENVGDFRLMDRRVVDAVLSLPEKGRFMKGLFSWVGFKSIAVPYTRQARARGTSTWGYWKLWNFALDGLFGFSSLPLRIWTYAGALVAMVSLLYGAAIIVRKLVFDVAVDGWTSLMVAVVFFGGVQLISLGVMGEYLGRIFIESKNRPIYLVDSVSHPESSSQHGRATATSSGAHASAAAEADRA